jgi:hypothetical protein
MDVYGGAVYGFVSKQFLDGKKICPTLIKVGGKCVAKRMSGDMLGPVKTFQMVSDETAEQLTAHWLITLSAGEKPSPGFPVLIIIF